MRSKTLLLANLAALGYAGYLIWFFVSAIIRVGGFEYIEALTGYFDVVFELAGTLADVEEILILIAVLLFGHIAGVLLGSLIGWFAYMFKSSGIASVAAVIYLLSTIIFPIYFFYGLTLTFLGFVGANKQKKINTQSVNAS